jgi:hypothetical protein
MKTSVAVEENLHALLTSAPDGGQWLASRTALLTPKKQPRNPPDRRMEEFIHGLVVEAKRKILFCQESIPCSPDPFPSHYTDNFFLCHVLITHTVTHFRLNMPCKCPFSLDLTFSRRSRRLPGSWRNVVLWRAERRGDTFFRSPGNLLQDYATSPSGNSQSSISTPLLNYSSKRM